MIMRIIMLLFFAAACLGGCASQPRLAVASQPDVPTDWHMRLSLADRAAIDQLDATWHRARVAVPRRMRAAYAAEGPLVDPAVALPKPDLPPGLYYCRLIRFGGRAGFATAKPDFCTVVANADGVAFNKQSGASQPRGWLFGHNDTRGVFLGAFLPAHGGVAPAYGANPALNVAAVIERVSAFRWRMVMTRAGNGAVLDLYELVPVTPKVPGSVPAVAG
jgi:hypothetical protein